MKKLLRQSLLSVDSITLKANAPSKKISYHIKRKIEKASKKSQEKIDYHNQICSNSISNMIELIN